MENLQDNINKIEEVIKDFKFLAANTANDELQFQCNQAWHLLEDVRLQLLNIEELTITVRVSNENFKKDDLVTDGIKVMKATSKLVEAQELLGRRNWRKIIED
jgi:hypothetical protein